MDVVVAVLGAEHIATSDSSEVQRGLWGNFSPYLQIDTSS